MINLPVKCWFLIANEEGFVRLISHQIPVETGRWRRPPQEERLCTACNIIRNEEHYIYTCPEVDRSNLDDIPNLKELRDFIKITVPHS